MTENNENLKTCRYCGKKVQNLGAHIANLHPTILEKIEEFDEKTPKNINPEVVFTQPQGIKKNTADLIREKLDIMMDIKILEMLSQNKDLKEIQAAITPPQPQQSALDKLKEIREYSAIINDLKGGNIETETNGGSEWVGLATAALPIVQDLLKTKKQPFMAESEKNVRKGNTGSQGNLKPIQLEIAGDTGKPVSTLEKPGTSSNTEQ